MRHNFQISTRWEWELWRGGVLLDRWVEDNICVDEGLNDLLDVHFSGGTQKTAWYIGLFENNYFPDADDTYAVPGLTECTAYDEANRPQWAEAGPSNKVIHNSASKATFTMNASKTVYGGFLVGGGTGADTKGDTAGGGVLFATSRFASGQKTVEDDDVLKVTVSIGTGDWAETSSSSSSSSSSGSSSTSSSSSSSS